MTHAARDKSDVSEKRPYLGKSFFVVGPTAVGKSEFAAEVARRLAAEIVSADAFQIYRGLDLLTAKPEAATLAKATHHLIGSVPLDEEMNVEKYRDAAESIMASGKRTIVVGGTGLYIKALTHGLATLPPANQQLREKLERATTEELFRSLRALDPTAAATIDHFNRRRVIRAVEVCLLTGRPFSTNRTEWKETTAANGLFVYRDRDELYSRIDRRVEEMFANDIVAEVREAHNIGPTAMQMLGLREIRALIAGEISQAECIARIQQATRRYAKRQLTWFRRQTNFPSLNLSAHRPDEAVELISQHAARAFAGE